MKNDELTLVVGDKNLSSWSMRPWLVAKASGLDFKQVKIILDTPKTKAQIKKYSSSGKVPVLLHGKTHIWDSLAICEYLHELAPQKKLWPTDPADRAIARSYVAEMHSGFASLRSQLSMDIRLRIKVRHLAPQTISEIQRVLELWQTALKKSKGPYLFTHFGIVDAFYAPVVFRFVSYGIQIKNPLILKYMDTIQKNIFVKELVQEALKEKPVSFNF